ncbi:tRNA isopentenyltransferase [Diplocarpon rosae]|nr:tRNA isopentenyltransferase [Diplocarpon rosae]
MLRRMFGAISNVAMAMQPPRDPLIVILGATGTGKSQLAVDVAKRFNGEIINGDAIQMYEGLPIITNKITTEEQQGVPHHLLGFIAPEDEPWRVGLFKKKAGEIIREIRSRGRLPILVGGTHYYTQSLLFAETLVEEARSDEEHEHSGFANQEIAEKFPILEGPTEVMMERLKQVDPVMADRWHPKDRRKIRRSLEIFLLTGKKASDLYTEQHHRRSLNTKSEDDGSKDLLVDRKSSLLFWVHADSEILKARLDKRVDTMIELGLLGEVKTMERFLHAQAEIGVEIDRTRGIWVSIGWKEFEPYLRALDSETCSPAEVQKSYELSVEQTKAATRQYAKRQVRWIRLKLIPALLKDDTLDRLYLLDGSNAAQFAAAVSQPAIEITEKFLDGSKLMPPHELCDAAAHFLRSVTEKDETEEVHIRQECDICHVVALNSIQWKSHINSRRHRALLKKKQKNEASGRSSHQYPRSVDH